VKKIDNVKGDSDLKARELDEGLIEDKSSEQKSIQFWSFVSKSSRDHRSSFEPFFGSTLS
jgi:hypothetical protein